MKSPCSVWIVVTAALCYFVAGSAGVAQFPAPKAAAEQAAPAIAGFLADSEGRRPHDFPAWNDYRKLVGDTPATRAVFADMLRTEPELCAAMGGDTESLAKLLGQRIDAQYALRSEPEVTKDGLTYRGDRICFGNAGVGFRITLENLLVAVLVACREDMRPHLDAVRPFPNHYFLRRPPDEAAKLKLPSDALVAGLLSASVNDRWRDLRRRPGSSYAERLSLAEQKRDLLTDWVKGYVEPADAPARTRRSTFVQRQEVLERLLTKWALRESSPEMLYTRLEIVARFGLDEALLPVSLRFVQQHKPAGEPTEYAILALGRLGKKEHVRALARCLEAQNPLSLHVVDGLRYRRFRPELRDLALSIVVQLSGADPGSYGFVACKGRGVRYVTDPVEFRLLDTVESRNKAFERCRKDFAELGLEKPPAYQAAPVPRFLFVHEDSKPSDLAPLPTSPDGRLTLKNDGEHAQVVEAATGKPVGRQISAGIFSSTYQVLRFACWSFSPNGKLVVTGSGYSRPRQKEEKNPTDVGRIQVWNAETGELLGEESAGSVQRVTFEKDNRTIIFRAGPIRMDRS
jgi:hypothetical protein